MQTPKLPQRPPELATLSARRAELHAEAQSITAELDRLQANAWDEAHADETAIDRAAARLASGEIESASRDALPEQVDVLRNRLDLVERAGFKVRENIAEVQQSYNAQIARAYRPAHREAVARIYEALVALVDANTAEEALRAQVPGVQLRPATFPNCGKFGPHGGAAEHWRAWARREGLIDQDETAFPAAAL